MCPGGVIVPATAYPDRNIVNGMSLYHRDGRFANAACVAGVNLEALLGRTAEPWKPGLAGEPGGSFLPICPGISSALLRHSQFHRG